MYAKKLNIAGEDHLIETIILGEGDPTSEIEANIGQFYYNTLSKAVFKCVSIGEEDGEKVYTWEPLLSGETGALVAAGLVFDQNTQRLYAVNLSGGRLGAGVQLESTLRGTSDPENTTTGSVGQFYLNTTTGAIFKCMEAGITFDWQPIWEGSLGELGTSLGEGGKVLVEVEETVNGHTRGVLKRIPFQNFASALGADLDYDEETGTLYLVDSRGQRIGGGVTVASGVTGLNMYTETDDTGTQYLILEDGDHNELCRTEFTVTGTGGSTAYICRLINGMNGTKLSFPSGQACVLSYEFYEYYGAEQTTVNANAEVYVKYGTGEYELKRTQTIQQGANALTITDFLQPGTNYVKLQVTAGESGTVKVIVYTVNVVDISLTSSFDATQAYVSSISFPYRVTGRNIQKTMYFYVDGSEYTHTDIGTAHNIQLTETINLASYGHGNHRLECWFVTADGARSPSLVYDIMFDTGSDVPILSSVFDETEVNYGELIQIQYAVFTHGSETTEEVDLDIYTMSGQTVEYYQQSALADVVNESLRSWNITEYPSSGTVYLRITAKNGIMTAVKTFTVTVQENAGDRDLSGVTTRLIAAYNASGRSNSDANKSIMNAAYTSIDDVTTTIQGALAGFNWRSNGWTADNDGYPVLRVSGGAQVALTLPFFAASWTDSLGHTINLAGNPTAAGRTFEVGFRTSGVTDETEPVITIWDSTGGIGIKIFPSYAVLLSGTMSLTTDADGNIINKNAIPYVPFSSQDGKVRLTFVIEEVGHYVESEDDDAQKQLIRIYVNGQLAKALAYTSDTFTTSAALPVLKAESCILDVYSMRFYDTALTDSDVLKNYIADLPSLAERIEVYDKNDILDDNGNISFAAAALQYPCMVLTGELSAYKGNKVKIGCQLYKPDGTVEDGYYTVWEFMDKDGDGNYGNVNNVQGTSSQYYIKKNYKITFYRWDEDAGKFKKVKVAIFPDRIPVNTICIKADYMSPDGANTGNANFWQAICPEPTPPQYEDARVQTAVMGYPILLFQRATSSAAPSFIGRYNLNNDKGNSEAFGLENEGDEGNETKCQKWEYLDNSENICNFLTDQLKALRTNSGGQYYEAWEDALESCYPDQGDLEDEGMRPNLDYIQTAYTWLVQRANYIDASEELGSGGVYDGELYATEKEMRLAIFKAEFARHFNLAHTLWYFIANEVSLLVDNFAKNMFMTCYDVTQERLLNGEGSVVNIGDLTVNGEVDASAIDWINSSFAIWYPTLYDLDSCLGADNNGYDQFPYYKEMFDTYNERFIVNGAPSLFWRAVYGAFFPELKAMYRALRDTDKTLSPAAYLTAMIDNLTDKLPIVAVNKDEKFKYIDAYEGGYYDVSANDGQGGWVYTLSFLYLAKSTMESYHRDFISKRFAMLDSKYQSDAYMQDYVTFRINRQGTSTPAQLAFDVSPCQAMYCYTEWGNSGLYIGGKCLEGETVEMKPPSSGNWSDIVLAIYGASRIKSLGDLSVLYPSKPINLARCANLTELIVGSDAAGYENSVLDGIADVSYLKMLQKLDISNCTALSGTVDLSNCDLIEEVHAKGSTISAVVLPEGGYLKKLFLPAGITALNVVNHTNLTEFSQDSYANLVWLRVENTPNIDTAAILADRGTNLTRIRLVGVNWTLADETVLRILANDSMSAKAIDANGNAVQDSATYPTVTGEVTISRIQGSLLSKLNTRYPNLTIHYTTKYHKVVFKNEGTTVSTQEINDGAAATTPATPVKAATVQYVYSFAGWSASYAAVTADMTITAGFTSSVQQYQIKFYDGTPEAPGNLLATVNSVEYGTDYTYPEDFPTKAGYVFNGWIDADGELYEYATQQPDRSSKIDGNGSPQTINLYPDWSAIALPAATKDFAALTAGERVFAATAIQTCPNGGTYTRDGVDYEVVYSASSSSYFIYNSGRSIQVTVALGDAKQWVLYNGETLTQEVIDFNHDYSDLAETQKLGLTFAMKDLLTDAQLMNPSYKHAFNYQFGDEDPIVSDTNNHTSGTDAALTHTHEATADEISAGFVEITALGPTYLAKIEVAHTGGFKTTWHFDQNGFYCGTDSASFTSADGACTWYKSDILADPDNPEYKIGKMLQSLGLDVKNWQGSVGVNGWATTAQQWCTHTNRSDVFTSFGGLKIDTTGEDTVNTAALNPFNGTGKSRLTFCKDWTAGNSWNNFTEVSEGTVISVPVESGDVVTVVCYGLSRNWGGWEASAMKAWANGAFLDQLPFALRSTITPALKKSSWGNRSYAIRKGLSGLWCLSNAEVGGYINNSPYKDEGSRYPQFVSNDARIKRYADGSGAVGYWWERSPYVYYSSHFNGVYTSGYPYGNNSAYTRTGVCLGFCSGETA